jgi:hypothetical protein
MSIDRAAYIDIVNAISLSTETRQSGLVADVSIWLAETHALLIL